MSARQLTAKYNKRFENPYGFFKAFYALFFAKSHSYSLNGRNAFLLLFRVNSPGFLNEACGCVLPKFYAVVKIATRLRLPTKKIYFYKYFLRISASFFLYYFDKG